MVRNEYCKAHALLYRSKKIIGTGIESGIIINLKNMFMYWLWYILIGIVAGYLGSLVVKGTGSGLLLNLVIGVIGSVLGGWLFGLMGLDSTNMLGSLITATIGAIVLLLIVALFTRKRY